MKVEASGIPDVPVYAQGSSEFNEGLLAVAGSSPPPALAVALPFSVVLRNDSPRAIALVGVRFDMGAPDGKPCSVVHYADTLRNPDKAAFQPGAWRFFCAEPAFTSMVNRGESKPDGRGVMNVENLRRMLQVRASLDCIAFADGEFAGPDTDKAFNRLAREGSAETAFLNQFRNACSAIAIRRLLNNGERSTQRVVRTAARTLLEAFQADGLETALQRAREYRQRITLWR